MEYFFNIHYHNTQSAISASLGNPITVWRKRGKLQEKCCGENKILKQVLGYIYDSALEQSQNKRCNLNLHARLLCRSANFY